MFPTIARGALGVVVAVLVACSSALGGIEEAGAAYERGDYATALREAKPLAEKGAPWALFLMGVMAVEGKGVAKDYERGHDFFRRAADKGLVKAQFALASLYYRGWGVERDFGEAARWARIAADAGDEEAQFLLGVIYAKGEGIERNYALAERWLAASAAQGHAEALSTLKELRKNLAELRKLGIVPPEPEVAAVPPARRDAEPAGARSARDGGAARGAIAFGRYHALVIGNNDYRALANLKTARNDARAVAEVLERNYGFRVQRLFDATRSDIVTALNDLRARLTDQDNLLVYYAGHGYLDEDADEGYWLPVDADPENLVQWVANATITRTLRAMRAKHVLVVADSCFAGKLARGAGARPPDHLERLAIKRARTVLTLGGLEPVADAGGKGEHSVFAAAFLEELRSNSGVLEGIELFSRIPRPVMLAADQTPEYADIRKAGHDGGDFLFVRVR